MDDIIDYEDRPLIKLNVKFDHIDVIVDSGDIIIDAPESVTDNIRKPSATIISNNNNKTLW